MAEFDTDFLVPNGTEANGTTHYDKVNFTSKAGLMSMTGYVKPASPSAITASDSVLTAIGKLESGATVNLPSTIAADITGTATTANNIPTQSGHGNIWIS